MKLISIGFGNTVNADRIVAVVSPEAAPVKRIVQLAKKVQEILSITPRDGGQEQFLQTILRDYQYYALEEI